MRRKGFTMVEVLVVIAVIGILAAILFPVFSKAKDQVKKGVDMTNMKSIWQALKLYQQDLGAYPPLLLQVAEYNGATKRRIYDLKRAFLYNQGRVRDINIFKSEVNDEKQDATVQVCWPTRDSRVNASQPGEYQAGGPADFVTYEMLGIDPTTLNGQAPTAPAELYAYDSYDIGPSFNPGCVGVSGNKRWELRYILFWTALGQGNGGPLDSRRQLGYNDPLDSTVVTWNNFFQSTKGTPALPGHNNKGTIVLYLNGACRLEDGKDVFDQSWRFGQ